MNEHTYGDFFEGMRLFLIQFAKALTVVHEWYERNAENIAKYLLLFADIGIWYSATDKLAEKQIVFTDDLTLDFAKKIYESSNIDILVQEYYFSNDARNMMMLSERCGGLKEITPYKKLYEEILDAYQRTHYHLACIGMFAILDGVLADVSHMITSTSFNARIKSIENKISDKIELNELDKKILCIYISMERIKETMFGESRFYEVEPEEINRHWLVHGRTRKSYTRYEFLKILLCLDAISYMVRIGEKLE